MSKNLMNKTKTSVLIAVMAIVTLGLLSTTISSPNVVDAQQEGIPKWIQNVAGFWSNEDISDQEFVNAMEFLVEEGIMKIPSSMKTAQAEEVTRTLEDLEVRLEKIEKQTTAGESTTQTNPPSSGTTEEPKDSAYDYTFAICPSDKIRHFDKIHFKLNLGLNGQAHSSKGYESLSSSHTNIVILEERYDEVGSPFQIEKRIASHLNELGYTYMLNGDTKVGILADSLEILDIEYAVICANKPGISQSGGTLGYK